MAVRSALAQDEGGLIQQMLVESTLLPALQDYWD